MQRVERRAVAEPPFVEVAEQQGRLFVRAAHEIEHDAGLLRARTAQQAEMGGDDAQRLASLEVDLRHHRAARLESRKLDLMHVADDALLEQQDIAVPAMALAGREIGTGTRPVSRSSRGRSRSPSRSPKRLSASCRAMTSGSISRMTRLVRSGSNLRSMPTHLWTL